MDRLFEPLGLDHVGLHVKDQAASRRFYTEVLGCTLEHLNAKFSLVHLRFGQHLIDLLPLRPNAPAPAPEHGMDHLCLSIRCDDLETVAARLRARGGAGGGGGGEGGGGGKGRGSSGAGRSGTGPRSTCGIPTATGSSSSLAEGKAKQDLEELVGGDRSALGRRLKQAPFGRAQTDRREHDRVQVPPERARRDALDEDLLHGQPELLPEPRHREPEALVAPRPEPSLEQQAGEALVAGAKGPEQDVERALQLDGGGISPLGQAGQLLDEGERPLLDGADPHRVRGAPGSDPPRYPLRRGSTSLASRSNCPMSNESGFSTTQSIPPRASIRARIRSTSSSASPRR